MNSKFKEVFNSYIEQQNRLSTKLQRCVYLLQQHKNKMEVLKSRVKKINEPLKLFRVLILIHTCYLKRILQPQATVELLSMIKKLSKPRPKVRLDQIVNQEVITKYVLYLQKCHQCLIEPLNQEYMDASQKLFCSLNLLKIGLSFVDILYTFGRYFRNCYMFIVDFNLVIALDFGQLYEKKIKSTLKNNRSLWNAEMRLQMERIHEQMYIVYYNCYFYKEIKNLIPRFIETELLPAEKSHQSLSKENRSKLYLQTKTKCDSNMSMSTVLGNSNVKSRERNSFSMAKSSIFARKEIVNGSGSRFSKFDMSMNKNMVNQSYVSQFTSDVSDKKQQYVIDEEDQQRENPFRLIQSLERVIAVIDEKQKEKLNKQTIQTQ